MTKATTKGGVVLEDIKIGDIHYEYRRNMCIKTRVIETPMQTETDEGDVIWEWKSIHIRVDGTDGEIIDYAVSEMYPHYGPTLYNHKNVQVVYKSKLQ